MQQRLYELVSGDVGVRRILSLCSGDGRDVLPVSARDPYEQRPELVLVELDPALAAAAERRAVELGVAATVLIGDAGFAKTWQSNLPVDLLMLCGIFGDISRADIRSTIAATRGMLAPNGSVIWTRGYLTNEDLRPQIVRGSPKQDSQTEIAFDSEPAGYGVGVNRLLPHAPTVTTPDRLFSFVR